MAAINVSNFDELKEAIEDDVTTEIVVDGDITFSGGAKVNTSKNSLTIDFSGHNVTDSLSSSFTTAIYVPANAPEILVTVKNAVWNGRNYYGVVAVYDGNTNVSLVLQNINYKGPQFVYNKNGSTKIVDCTCVLDKGESSTNPQELGEVNRLTISGNVVVNSNSTSNSVLWFTGTGAELLVEEGAYFEVNALSTYLCYTDSSPTLTFGKNSKTFIITKSGLFYGAGSSLHIASSFTLSEGATFSSTRNESNAVPMLKCVSDFVVEENATLNLFSPSEGTSALIYFGKAANMTISSPKNVVLYNNGGNVFSFATGSASSPNVIKISTKTLHFWDIATTPLSSAGGIDDTPTSTYHKAEYAQDFTATINLSNSAILSIDTNLVDGDEGHPVSTAFPLMSSKVISMGALPLEVNKITDSSLNITGTTDPYAAVKITDAASTVKFSADENGQILFALKEKYDVGTKINFVANKNFLYHDKVMTADGSVAVIDPQPLLFHSFSTMPNKTTIFRANPDWSIEVRDTRESGGDWFLYAYVNSPLASGANTLDNAFVYVEQPNVQALSSTPILIHRESFSQNSITTIKWQEMEGFLLNLDPSATYASGDYSTTLYWEVRTEE